MNKKRKFNLKKSNRDISR